MREFIKISVHWLARLAVVPCLVIYWAEAFVVGKNVALCNMTEFLALFPGVPGRYLRTAFLTMAIAECDRSASIGFGTTFSKCGARVGKNTYIGANCSIGLATIHDGALIASGVYVTSGAGQHGMAELDVPIREQNGVDQRVVLGAGCWIGTNAVVMADVGTGAVVAAGAVVTKALPDFVIAGGVPARVLRSRRPADQPPEAS
jgi:acetyltransferase-like isoleucine patch superfamily enzyme